MAFSVSLSSVEKCDTEEIVSSYSYGCPGGPDKSKAKLCKVFLASQILTQDDDDSWTKQRSDPANYWLAENKKVGPNQGFIMSLGCKRRVAGVNLINTHNAGHKDRSTKKFRVLGSDAEDGPWEELLVADLEDSRKQSPPPLQKLQVTKSAEVSFVKFELLKYYGHGGGLQYFEGRI